MLGRRLGHFEIVSLLGQGGMGAVYKARDTHLDRVVALKVLPHDKMADPDRRRRFSQEAKAASALNHPNIVTIYEIASDEGIDFIAMEFVEGRTLESLLTSGPLQISETIKYARQIADGLAAAHAAGILHRDLKPANIMVRENGIVKLLDFGLAKLTISGGSGETDATLTMGLTQAGAVMGTFAYMSPEQAQGKKLDFRSDLFSFGVILYEMVAGKRAFDGDSQASVLASLLRDDPPPVSDLRADVPPDLERLISRCLRKDIARRVQTAADLKAALDDLYEAVGRSGTTALLSQVSVPPASPASTIQAATIPATSIPMAPIPPAPPVAALPSQLPPPSHAAPPFQPAPAPYAPTQAQPDSKWSSRRRRRHDRYGHPIGPPLPGKPRKNLARRAILVILAIWLIPKLFNVILPFGPSSKPPAPAESTDLGLRSVPLTNDAGLAREASFSPDGTRVVYSWNGADPRNFDIYVRSLSGGDPRRLTTDNKDDFEPAWSPEGDSIAFLRRHDAEDEILVVPASGFAERIIGKIPHRVGNSVAWAARSRALVFPDSPSSGAPTALYEQTLATGAKRRIVKPAASGTADLWPAIPRSGSRVAFVREFAPGRSEIFAATMPDSDESDAEAEQVTSLRAACAHPTWTGNQRLVVFSFTTPGAPGSSGTTNLWEIAPDGKSGPRPLIGLPPGGDHPAIAPSGGRMVYNKQDSESGGLWLVDPFRLVN